MTKPLIIFDCDGTLVDSQHLIIAAMTRAFVDMALEPPDAAQTRRIVGLSLDEAIRSLTPDSDNQLIAELAERYRSSFLDLRAAGQDQYEVLYPGVADTLDRLVSDGYRLGVATGKGMRGLRKTLARHALEDYFMTLQTADQHPSKPHPAMLHAALAETGTEASGAILIGDTVYDMMMATSAGVAPIGVGWGYHRRNELLEAGALQVLDKMPELPDAIDAVTARNVAL